MYTYYYILISTYTERGCAELLVIKIGYTSAAEMVWKKKLCIYMNE